MQTTLKYLNAPPGPRQGPISLPHSYPKGYPQTSAVVTPRRTAGKRLLRTLLVAVAIWSLFSLVVHNTVTDFRWIHHRHWDLTADDWDYTIPGDVSLEECVQGGEWSPPGSPSVESSAGIAFPYHSETSFVLPIASETLFFLSRGQKLVGAVNVVTSKEQAEDSVTVRVAIKYYREEVRDLAKACLLSRREGENGVGIFTPVWRLGRSPRGKEYDLGYNMTIILPEFSSPLTIKNFETDVQNTVQNIEDPDHKIFFHSISLSGSNGPIQAKSLTAIGANIHTTNGPISGIFNVTNTLKLGTSNSPISVSVGLESEKAESKLTFNARTSNSPLHANISLTSAVGSGGSFDITTTTSNSPLRVTFPISPVDSKLNFTALTSNSPASVFLHSAYEGTFHLQTSLFGASVHQNPNVEDPSGEGRQRRVQYRNVGKGVRMLTGEVYWDESRKDQGIVSVRTSNSPVVLEV